MKLAIKSDLSETSLLFAQQMGVTHVSVSAAPFMNEDLRGAVHAEQVRQAQKKAADHDLEIGVVLLPQDEGSQHWNIRLGRPERKKEIQDVCESIKILGGEGIPVVEYVFNLAAVFGSQRKAMGRGGAVVRYFDYEKAKEAPPAPGFASSTEEVWERITFFLEHVVPVAEKAGVKLACHPDDPPVPTIKGETRVLGSIEGMKRLLNIVPSEANGLMFCQGTVAEMGVDVLEAIEYFGSKIHHVHFRNVRGAVPRFNETFIDDGDVNMAEALKTYARVGYTGTLMPDHVPTVVGEDAAQESKGRAHAIGYIKGLMDALGV